MNPNEDCRLTYTDPTGSAWTLTLPADTARVTIGRSPRSDIPLDDTEVSQVHATLDRVGGHWLVVDDGLSRNGTFVNGERVAGRQLLRHGDRIRVGSTLFRFHGADLSTPKATRISSGVPTRRSFSDAQYAVLCALCRPYKHRASFASPAGNQRIAGELFVSPDTVKSHLHELFVKFGVEDLPPNQKRVRLVERAMQSGVVTDRDL